MTALFRERFVIDIVIVIVNCQVMSSDDKMSIVLSSSEKLKQSRVCYFAAFENK